MAKTISILGCGWLGVPLGKALLKSGCRVKGSVASVSKKEGLKLSGIIPFKIKLNPESIFIEDEGFFETDTLVVSIPPKRIENIEEVYPNQLKQIIPFIIKHGIGKVLFISSTSVYPEKNRIVKEEDAINPGKASGEALLKAERLFQGNANTKTTVLRFGGLIGAGRNPSRFLSRKTKPVNGGSPVNLIHRDDCIRIIKTIIEKNAWGEVFNACCPAHPVKKDFYECAAKVSGKPMPGFKTQDGNYKIVDSGKLVKLLDYRFKYNDPIDYLRGIENGQ